ncbi:50S ribosomal protein L19 [Patescibacteria group bacterium]|nr:50S ribosomal protein L19 [Patescibacteria group bacterium]
MNDVTRRFVSAQTKMNIPLFKAGDDIIVSQKIKEGDKDRIQNIRGTVIARRHNNEIGATFTVRKVTDSVGIELTFPLHSPNIEKIEVVKIGKVRRAKLYYLRDRKGKRAKVKEKK